MSDLKNIGGTEIKKVSSTQKKCPYCDELIPDFNLWKIHLMSKHPDIFKKEKD